jgi:preprotein translocase subunit SecE
VIQILEPKNQGNAVVAFIKQVRDEGNQVTWPTREKTIKLTAIVIVVSVVVGIYLGALDILFTKLMGFII